MHPSKRLLALVLGSLVLAPASSSAQPSAPAPTAPAPAPAAPAPAAPAPVAPEPSEPVDAASASDEVEGEVLDVEVAPSESVVEDVVIEEEEPTIEGDVVEGSPEEPEYSLPDTLVVGRRAKDLDRVPGAMNVVTATQMRQMAPFNANEVMRRIPGVTIREEEGVGLRANIGIRGLNADRSRNVLVLEDGVPIQVMPYTYPELYYTPRIDRMRSVEVVKGSGSILFGPQTVAGVVNFVSLDPPDELNVRANLEYGSFNSILASASVGNTVHDVGYLLHVSHLSFEGNRQQDASVTDVMGKLRLDLHGGGMLRVKLQAYFEDSSASYLGLTTDQFRTNPAFNFVPDDRMIVNRFASTVSHAIDLGEHVELLTTAYGSLTERDWGRQSWTRTPPDASDPAAIAALDRVIDGTGRNIVGDPSRWTATGQDVYLYKTRGNFNRGFKVAGLESRATYRFTGFGERHRLIGGARIHYEDATTETLLGSTPTSQSGALLNDYTSRGIAFAAYAQLRLGFLRDKLEVTPGFRLESLWVRNVTYRAMSTDVSQPAATQTTVAPIPGIGASYAANEHVTVYGGIHRGFAPPRIYDAIFGTGVQHAKSQFSWNYELGTRLAWADWFHSDVSGFVLAFANQAITPSEASNAMNSDGTAISGATRSAGVEVSSTWDLALQQGWKFGLPLTVAYTYIDARTVGTGWDAQYRDIFLPYVPKHHLNLVLGFTHRLGIEAQIDGDYQTYQYSDLFNTVDPDPAGVSGLVPSRFLLNARVAYRHRRTGLTFYVTGKNLLDARYIATRAPAGIFPGMFRQIMGGVSLDY